jgi:hypothetical protein
LPFIKPKNSDDKIMVTETDLPIVTKIEHSFHAISWHMSCSFDAVITADAQLKTLIQLSFVLQLTSDQGLFPEALRGTLPHQSSNGQSETWDINSEPLVIDDITDASGVSHNQKEYGHWLQEALRIGLAELRIKAPQIGKHIKLKSEGASESPKILFSWQETRAQHIPTIHIYNETTKLRLKSIVSIESPSASNTFSILLNGLSKFQLIENPEASIKESFQLSVLQKLGEAFGLKYKTSGYGLHNNWGNDLQTVMSFGSTGVPTEFLTDKIEYKQQDIAGIHEAFGQTFSEESDTIESDLAPDYETPSLHPETQTILHLRQALLYLAITKHPKMKQFRESNDNWREKITELYFEIYGIRVE